MNKLIYIIGTHNRVKYKISNINITKKKEEYDIYIESFNDIFGRSLGYSRHNSGTTNLKQNVSKKKRIRLVDDFDNKVFNKHLKKLSEFEGFEDIMANNFNISDISKLPKFQNKISSDIVNFDFSITKGTINSWFKIFIGKKKDLLDFLNKTYPLPYNRLICCIKLKTAPLVIPFDIYYIVYDVYIK